MSKSPVFRINLNIVCVKVEDRVVLLCNESVVPEAEISQTSISDAQQDEYENVILQFE